jgi:hypothetical protein
MNTFPECHETYQQDVQVPRQDGTRLNRPQIDSRRPIIFLSYASEGREAARAVAGLLESAGCTVWWDRRIPAGRTWRSMIEEALRDMRCMVVLWSSHSVDSDWVKEEAEEARAVGKLVPVLIEPVKPPVGFRSIQAAELTDWDGTRDCLGARQLIADLESMIGKETAQELPNKVAIPKLPYQKKPMILLAGGVFLVTLLIFVWGFVMRWKVPLASGPVQMVALLIQVPKTAIDVGQTVPLKVNARYSDGKEMEVSNEVQWASSNGSILTISPEGQAQAHSFGDVDVNARVGNVISPPIRLTISALSNVQRKPPPHVISLILDSDKQRLFVQDRAQLRVKARFSDGAITEVAEGVDWRSTDDSVVNINGNGQLEALKEGKARVTGRYGGVEAETILIDVQSRRAPTQKSPFGKPQIKGDARSIAMSNEGVGTRSQFTEQPPARKSSDTEAEKTTIVPPQQSRDVISEYIRGENQRRAR